MTNEINIGLAGWGMIGRLHGMNYGRLPFIYPGSLPQPILRTVCTSRPESAKSAAVEGGFLNWTTNLDEMLEDSNIDVVDVSLPNQMHKDVVTAALRKGKAVYCEKPLAGTVEDAREIARVVSETGAPFGMVFQYRFLPAVMKAREMISEGRLGRIFTWRAEYLHTGYQKPSRPMSWRMQKEAGGSGALGDLGSHVIDLVRFLLGDFDCVQGHLETFVKERPLSDDSGKMGTVTVDDVAWFRTRMADGSIGTVEASRFATGTMDDLNLMIHGEKGALRFHLMDPGFLHWFDEALPGGDYGGERGWRRIEAAQYYPGAKSPPARAPIGWDRSHTENQYAFLKAVVEKHLPSPGIADGLATQLVIDAVERSAAADGARVAVERE